MSRAVTVHDFDSSLVRKAIVALVALKCAGIVLVFDATSISAFDLTKAIFSRATEWLLVALIVLSLYRFGISVVPRTKLHLAIGLVLLANVASTVFAANRFVALYGEYERYMGLTFVVDMAVLYAAVAIGFRRTSDWIFLAGVGTVTTAAVLGYGAAQRLDLDPIPWVNDPSARPFATLGNPDVLARFLTVAFGISVGVSVYATGSWARLLRVVGIAVAIVLTVAAGIVATRSSLIGFGAAGIAGALLYLVRAPRDRLGRRMLLVVGTAAIVVGLLAASPITDRLRAIGSTGFGPDDRLSIYRTAVAAFQSRPIVGYGPDGFGVAYPSHRDERDVLVHRGQPQSNAHSWILQALATTGLVGFASLLFAIVAFCWTLLTAGLRRQPWLAGPLLVALAGYWAEATIAVGAVGVDWFPWVAFGAAAAIAGERPVAMPSIRPLWRFASVAVVCAALAAASFGLLALSAAEQIGQARLQWLRRSPTSIELAESALRRDPGRADYWNWLGLTRDLSQNWRLSGDAYAEAARRAPHDSTFWSNLARSRARQALANDGSSGGASAALDAARRAVDEDPNDSEANFVLGEIASVFGEPELAISAAVKAVVLYPIEPLYEPVVLRSARAMSDLRFAASQLDIALRARDSALIRVAAAEVALRMGDLGSAQAHARRAAELAPNDPEVVKLLRLVPR